MASSLDAADLRRRVSRIGLGLAALGRPGYINVGHAEDLGGQYDLRAMERQAHAVLDAAVLAGVRYVDVARSYGEAESFLAGWLANRAVGQADLVIGSKWGYVYTAEWRVEASAHEVKEHSAAMLRRQWSESRARLGHHLALYQIHSATPESGVLEDRAVLAELATLAGDGVVVGLSVSGPSQAATVRKALDLAVDGKPLFGSVQATWNVLEPSCGPALAEAHQRGCLVIVKEALANGRLTARNPDAGLAGAAAVLSREAGRLCTSLDALAMAAALAQPWADVVLSGAARVDHLQSNLCAYAVPFDDGAAHGLAALAEPPVQYWATRGGLPWN